MRWLKTRRAVPPRSCPRPSSSMISASVGQAEVQQPHLVPCLHKLVHQGRRSGDPLQSLLAVRSQGDVRLADSVLPMAMTFSRRSMYSQRASWVTSCLYRRYGRSRRRPGSLRRGRGDPARHQAVMSVYELQLRQPEQVVRIVHV